MNDIPSSGVGAEIAKELIDELSLVGPKINQKRIADMYSVSRAYVQLITKAILGASVREFFRTELEVGRRLINECKYCSRAMTEGVIYCSDECRFHDGLFIASNGCWLWQGVQTTNDRGIIALGRGSERRQVYAHRYAYEKLVGEIPEGHIISQRCGNVLCCNPDHMLMQTNAGAHRSWRGKKRREKMGIDEKEFIWNNMDKMTLKEMATHIGYTVSAVYGQTRKIKNLL